jgi:hypothetical protein
MRRTCLITICLLIPSAKLLTTQQTLDVYYNHAYGATNSDLTYTPPGDLRELRRTGLGSTDTLAVDEGTKACFMIEHPNRLLYSYNVGSKAVFSIGRTVAGMR